MVDPWDQDWGAQTTETQQGVSAAPWEQNWDAPRAGGGFDLPSFGYGAADTASFGFGDEMVGALAGAGAALSGGDYSLAYRRRVDEARVRLDEARRLHPISTMAGQFAGAAPAMLIPGLGEANAARVAATGARAGLATRLAQGAGRVLSGEALPYGRQLLGWAAGRGPVATLAQAGRGLIAGGLYGGVYGAGEADGDLATRAGGALQTGAIGAGFGAVSPLLFQGLLKGVRGEALAPAVGNALLRAGSGGIAGAGVGLLSGQDPIQSAGYGALAGVAGRPILSRLGGPVLAGLRNAWDAPRRAAAALEKSQRERAFAMRGRSGPAQIAKDVGVHRSTVNRWFAANDRANAGGVAGLPPINDDMAAAAAPIGDTVVRDIDRMLGRQRYGVEELANRINAARAHPMERTLADIGGEQFLAKTDALAQLPGQTGQRAAALAEARVAALPGQLTEELQSRLGINSTPTEALNTLSAEYQQISRDLYQPILAQDISVEAQRRLTPVLSRFPRRVLSRVETVMGELAEADGVSVQSLRPAQRIHYMKMALDDAIQGLDRSEGLGAAQRASLRRLKSDFLETVEGNPDTGLPPIIPGYREARMRWGGLKDAEEALTLGSEALNQRPHEVRAIMARLTPFERRHYQIAVGDQIARRVMRSAGVVGQRNAANALNTTELQNIIREVFDKPKESEYFLRIVNERNQLLRNASGWVGNSATARRAAHAGDQLFASIADASAGGPQSVARRAVGATWEALRGRAMERRNDALGDTLLRAVDRGDPVDDAYLSALLARLRKMEADRIGRARDAGSGAALGAVGGGRIDDSGY